MIKIIKEGARPKIKRVIYKNTCKRCGCEFEFEKGDCDYVDKSLEGNVCCWSIRCPYCKTFIFGNNLYNLESREEVEEYK